MKEKEMRARIREIDKIRRELAEEKRKYEIELVNQENKNILAAHKEFEGKYFKTMNLQNANKSIEAFKILEVLDGHHKNHAKCITLVNGYRTNCWITKAITIEVLPVWCSNINSIVSGPNDPKMIDMYEMIDEKEFIELYNSYLKEFNLKES